MKNKYQEALDNLVYCKSITRCKECKHKNLCTMERDSKTLQELVDKATPKKPTKTSEEVRILGVSTTFTMWYRYCPSCRVMLNPNGYEKPNYCRECGQHLDWSD